MKHEAYIKMNADTIRLIREENLQPFDDESCYKVDAVSEAANDLGLKPSKVDNSVYMDNELLSPGTISLCVTWYES